MTTILITSQWRSKDLTVDPAGNHFVYEPLSTGSLTTSDYAALVGGVHQFYTNHFTGQTLTLAGYYATSLDWSHGIDYKLYDITGHLAAGSVHGPPLAMVTPAMGVGMPSTVTNYPEGVAAALSYHGDYGTDPEFVRDPVTHKVTGRPRARHRGRLYLGPLNNVAFGQAGTTNRCILTTAFQQDAFLAFEGIKTIHDGASNAWNIKHWSKKNARTEIITNMYWDDRPDYQRRRSDQSTTRVSAIY